MKRIFEGSFQSWFCQADNGELVDKEKRAKPGSRDTNLAVVGKLAQINSKRTAFNPVTMCLTR